MGCDEEEKGEEVGLHRRGFGRERFDVELGNEGYGADLMDEMDVGSETGNTVFEVGRSFSVALYSTPREIVIPLGGRFRGRSPPSDPAPREPAIGNNMDSMHLDPRE